MFRPRLGEGITTFKRSVAIGRSEFETETPSGIKFTILPAGKSHAYSLGTMPANPTGSAGPPTDPLSQLLQANDGFAFKVTLRDVTLTPYVYIVFHWREWYYTQHSLACFTFWNYQGSYNVNQEVFVRAASTFKKHAIAALVPQIAEAFWLHSPADNASFVTSGRGTISGVYTDVDENVGFAELWDYQSHVMPFYLSIANSGANPVLYSLERYKPPTAPVGTKTCQWLEKSYAQDVQLGSYIENTP